MDQANGLYDAETRTIYPQSTGTWDGLDETSWDSWGEWIYDRADEIIWVTQPVFLGNSPSPFNLRVTTVSTGEVSYKVYTSDEGAFNGEEVETEIPHGDVSIPGFRSKYIQVVVYSTEVNGITPVISEITVETVLSRTREFIISDVDTALCNGTITARILPLPEDVGNIVEMLITPKEVTAYNLDFYVSNTATSTYLIPKIISKDRFTPTIALVGVDNQPRDGVVDVLIKSLPASYMQGNNIVVE